MSQHLNVFEFAALIRLLARHGISLVIRTDEQSYHYARSIEAEPLFPWMLPEPVRELIEDFRTEIRAMAGLYSTRRPSSEWVETLHRLGVRAQVRYREGMAPTKRLPLPGSYAIRFEVWSAPRFPERAKAEIGQPGVPAASRAPDGPPQHREHLALVSRVEQAARRLASLVEWGSRWGVRPDATLEPLTVTLAECRPGPAPEPVVSRPAASTLNHSQQVITQAMTPFLTAEHRESTSRSHP